MAIKKEYPITAIEGLDINITVWECKTQKEILDYLDEALENEEIWLSGENPHVCNPFEDDAFYILYNDGAVYIKLDGVEEGVYKKKNIKAIVWNNPEDTMVYGDYEVNEYGVVTYKE